IYMLSRVEPCLFRLFVCYLQMACLSYTAQVSQSQLGLHTSQWQIPCGSIDGTCQCHTRHRLHPGCACSSMSSRPVWLRSTPLDPFNGQHGDIHKCEPFVIALRMDV